MNDNITYKFCIESLRYVYNIIGYDNAIKELNFIHHLNSNTSNVIQHVIQEPISELHNEHKVISEIIETPSENKNIVIQPSNTKYARPIISDEERCETILSTGKRCTLRKAENCSNCGRHTK